jgi:hypothetical protein
MSFWSDFLVGIPANEVLRQRVALAEEKFKNLEGENKQLTEHLAALTTENASLKQQLTEANAELRKAEAQTKRENEKPEIMYGCYYFDGDPTRLYCTGCYELHGKKHLMTPADMIGRKCPVCRNFVSNL